MRQTRRRIFMRSLPFLLVLVGCLLLAGCASLSGTFEQPRVAVAGLTLEDANLLSQTFGVRLRIDNPNDYRIKVDGADVRIALNGQPLAQGLSNRSVSIPRYGSANLEISATTELLGLLQQILVLGTRQNVDYEVSGHMNLGRGFLAGTQRFPFRLRGVLDLWRFNQGQPITEPLRDRNGLELQPLDGPPERPAEPATSP
jgi:LEA14-like dessication related protein